MRLKKRFIRFIKILCHNATYANFKLKKSREKFDFTEEEICGAQTWRTTETEAEFPTTKDFLS